jgi:hypothetical protein
MRIQKRLVDVKRHTSGYKIGGKWFTRSQAVSLAKQGKLQGVSIRTRAGITYIQSTPGHTMLYDLPISVK